jgi:hypothetical protein
MNGMKSRNHRSLFRSYSNILNAESSRTSVTISVAAERPLEAIAAAVAYTTCIQYDWDQFASQTYDYFPLALF